MINKLKELYRRFEPHIPVTQNIVAILTGVITIVGAAYAVYRFVNPADDRGRMEAVIVNSESGGPVAGARLEILSAGKALLTTIQTDQNGRVSYVLKEGKYDVRVRQEGFFDVTRGVQITPGQKVDLTVRLPPAAIPVKGIGNAMKKIIGK
jgi:5-hydroxyisourate hydrolase-like protein (transthyretin family)